MVLKLCIIKHFTCVAGAYYQVHDSDLHVRAMLFVAVMPIVCVSSGHELVSFGLSPGTSKSVSLLPPSHSAAKQ